MYRFVASSNRTFMELKLLPDPVVNVIGQF